MTWQLDSGLDAFWFVGILEHFDASLCLLRSQLLGSRACDCPARQDGNETSGWTPEHKKPRTAHKGPSGNGVNSSLILTPIDRQRIEAHTREDAVLYAQSLVRFRNDLRRYDLLCLVY